jgi:hypothetical protein
MERLKPDLTLETSSTHFEYFNGEYQNPRNVNES